MQIRPAIFTDISGIQHVANETWHSAYAEILRPDTVENVLQEFYSDESLEHSLSRENAHFLIAEDAGQLIGFIQALPRPDAVGYELTRLYILPAYQRQGLGHQLWQALEQRLSVKKISVLVEADNQPAIAFFRAIGLKSHRTISLPLFGEIARFVEFVKCH